jgi:outer membrane protein assembly factor BamD
MMNKKMKLWIPIAALVMTMGGALSSCSTGTDPSDAYKGEPPRAIYLKGKAALQDKSYSEASKRFEALDIQYPYSPDNTSAQLYLIYAYHMREEFILAESAAERFIRLHPTHPDVDYAYYLRGLADYYQNMGVLEKLVLVDIATRDLSQIQKSYADFNELVVRFPNSRYAAAAHQYMVHLRNVLAQHELEVGEYYYDRRAYVAAANRASGLVAHFQGSPSVVGGLILMAKSYHQLGLTKMEGDAVALLQYNYPYIKIDYRSDYRSG